MKTLGGTGFPISAGIYSDSVWAAPSTSFSSIRFCTTAPTGPPQPRKKIGPYFIKLPKTCGNACYAEKLPRRGTAITG
jgi:hypothetical protein